MTKQTTNNINAYLEKKGLDKELYLNAFKDFVKDNDLVERDKRKIIVDFVRKNELDESVYKNNMIVLAVYRTGNEKAVLIKPVHQLYNRIENPLSLYLNDISQLMWNTIHLKLQFDDLYIGKIIDGVFIINAYYEYEFLRQLTISPNSDYLYDDDVDIEEKKLILKTDLESCLYNQDFVTINMLTRYFIFDRSNLHRFMKDQKRSLGVQKVNFILEFLHRPIIDLNYGEIKFLISANCSDDPEKLVEIIKMYGLTLPKFHKIISNIEDDTLTVYDLKEILYQYHDAVQLNDRNNAERSSKTKLKLKHRLELSNQYSFQNNRLIQIPLDEKGEE